MQYTVPNGTHYTLDINIKFVNGAGSDKGIGHGNIAVTKNVSMVQRLQRRYRHAALFFEQRMKTVDSIIEIAHSKGLSNIRFLKLIEEKYPMAKEQQQN